MSIFGKWEMSFMKLENSFYQGVADCFIYISHVMLYLFFSITKIFVLVKHSAAFKKKICKYI